MDIVIKALDELKSINYSIGEVFSDEVSYIEEMCNNKKFKVVVIGEFSAGKSTFLNALVGKRILYSNMDEATGITTTIENIKNNVAIINFEDGDIKKIPIGTEENYKELSNYLNINKQDGKKVKYVDIQYSFDGIDEDIVFVDTPGLQGMSDEQLLITKEVIRDANATIMLINKKGLSQTELDLICGKNESFGRIRTKEIFILINKIGEVYDSNSDELSDEKVEKIISQVKLVILWLTQV
ncbi:dynamin family protein [Paraclostridium bifermentans]|uniref:dynamin family protein n=1 Tax=Paraclostridium bifermentans TaxID=1490 RepID=UPI002430543C|nr:dynamin family protein [Paraclostridium bifermentans]